MRIKGSYPDRVLYKGNLYQAIALTQEEAIVAHISKLAKDMVSITEMEAAPVAKLSRMKSVFDDMKEYFRFIIAF